MDILEDEPHLVKSGGYICKVRVQAGAFEAMPSQRRHITRCRETTCGPYSSVMHDTQGPGFGAGAFLPGPITAGRAAL